MCFTVTGRKKTSRKDIVVYKILFKGNISPYEGYKYNYKIQPRIDLKVSPKGSIHKVYHFFRDYQMAIEVDCVDFMFRDTTIRPYLIPQGTKYYENEHHIVAETCKMLTKKEAKQWT